MKQSIFKRVLPLAMVTLLLFAAGCSKTPTQQKVADAEAELIASGGNAEPQSESTGMTHSSLYTVDGETTESNNETYASNTEDANSVLVERLGVLTMTSADINKTADATGDYTSGNNAAVAVISKGQLTLNQSNITTNGIGAVGMIVSGEGGQRHLGLHLWRILARTHRTRRRERSDHVRHALNGRRGFSQHPVVRRETDAQQRYAHIKERGDAACACGR